MNKVRITAIRQTVYTDLMAKYENPIEHTCDVREGQQWISIDGQKPEGMCPSAWYSMREFVESLARGEGNFYDGWMKNPMSAMISCNDGFRPFSFYIEVTDEEDMKFKRQSDEETTNDVGDMKFVDFEEILERDLGKVGTPKRDEFERKVDKTVRAQSKKWV